MPGRMSHLSKIVPLTLPGRLLLLPLFFCFQHNLAAQENYEIQVYGSKTVDKHATMLELHSNYTSDGQKEEHDGVLPTNGVFHETVEVTHGFTDCFETGIYFFNTIGSGNRTNYVGSHIRPRIMAPEKWRWPVGLSLSTEFGYQKRAYSPDDWSLEIRPIIDKTWKRFYFSLNPTFEKSFHGLNQHRGFDFSPNVKVSGNINRQVALGMEYYGAVGNIVTPDAYQQQQHQLFIVADIEWSEDWEFNAGYGIGFTDATDNGIFKVILGYRFHKQQRLSNANNKTGM
jgi:hypothetical protein